MCLEEMQPTKDLASYPLDVSSSSYSVHEEKVYTRPENLPWVHITLISKVYDNPSYFTTAKSWWEIMFT